MSSMSVAEAAKLAADRVAGMSERALQILITGYWITDIGCASHSQRAVELWWKMSGYFSNLSDKVDRK